MSAMGFADPHHRQQPANSCLSLRLQKANNSLLLSMSVLELQNSQHRPTPAAEPLLAQFSDDESQ